MVIGKRSPHPYLNPQAFHCIFLLLLCSEGGVIEQQLGGHPVASQGQPNPTAKYETHDYVMWTPTPFGAGSESHLLTSCKPLNDNVEEKCL